MRLVEFITEETEDVPALISVLQVIRNRSRDTNTTPSISTQSLINLVKNTVPAFSYDALVDAHESSDAVKELIKSFNVDRVDLRGFSDEQDMENGEKDSREPGQNGISPTDTVSRMASRALNKRN